MHVLGRVFPHGCGLALGSIGFGTIATFITLYYATQHWSNAVLSLSLFGASFIGARLLFGNLINRLGGFRVAIACLSVETLGLLLLWLAPDAHWALAGAALSGFGFSLVFPALGVEAVNLVPASSRGAAVGAYSLFIDLSLGITGPLAGAIAAGFGFASIFLFAALAALSGLMLSVYLYRQAPKYREERDAR
jgi:MFS family permease